MNTTPAPVMAVIFIQHGDGIHRYYVIMDRHRRPLRRHRGPGVHVAWRHLFPSEWDLIN